VSPSSKYARRGERDRPVWVISGLRGVPGRYALRDIGVGIPYILCNLLLHRRKRGPNNGLVGMENAKMQVQIRPVSRNGKFLPSSPASTAGIALVATGAGGGASWAGRPMRVRQSVAAFEVFVTPSRWLRRHDDTSKDYVDQLNSSRASISGPTSTGCFSPGRPPCLLPRVRPSRAVSSCDVASPLAPSMRAIESRNAAGGMGY
jgi:hypothetical protein